MVPLLVPRILTALALAFMLAIPAMPAMGGISGPEVAAGAADADIAKEALEDLATGPEAQPTAGASRDVAFEQNLGQFHEDVRFATPIAGGEAAFLDHAIVLRDTTGRTVVLDLQGSARPVGEARLPGVAHHFTGDQAVHDAPRFDAIRYPGIHDGIDVRVYAKDGSIEFDHIVAPGADAGQARFTVQGALPRIAADGALDLGEGLRLKAPFAYQEGVDDLLDARVVPVAFSVEGQDVGYDLGAFDPTRPLVIDPSVQYASYHGSSGNDYIEGIEVMDHPTLPDQRFVYIAGRTSSTSFPAFSALNLTYGSPTSYEGFAAKFQYDLQSRTMVSLWTAIFGGSSSEYAYGTALTDDGDLYVTGYTYSVDFPVTADAVNRTGDTTTPYYDGTVRQPPGGYSADAFVVRFDALGNLEWGSYLGGESYDYGHAVVADGGHVYVTGRTTSTTGPSATNQHYPTHNAYQEASAGLGRGTDAFVTGIDTTTTPARFLFSTFLGGQSTEYGYGIDTDGTQVYVTGYTTTGGTSGVQFPTTSDAVEPTRTTTGTRAYGAAFDALDGSAVYVTFLGGDSSEIGYGRSVAALANGSAVYAGYTRAPDFPVCGPGGVCTPAPIQSTFASGSIYAYDGFVAMLDRDGTAYEYATYVGGNNYDYVRQVDVDDDEIMLAGYSSSTTWPAWPGTTLAGSSGYDLWAMRFDPWGGGDVHAAVLHGGTSSEYGYTGVMDSDLNMYFGGYTWSTAYPTTANTLQDTREGFYDGVWAIHHKTPPAAVIRGNSAYAGFLPDDTLNAASYAVPTFTDVPLDANLSIAGDNALDETLFEWTWTDPNGAMTTTTGGWVPSFSPLHGTSVETHEVCLRVWDDDTGGYARWDEVCWEITFLNRAPSVDAIACPALVQTGREVTLSATGLDPEGGALAYAWDMDDGTDLTGATVGHTYATAGTYNVTLTVKDPYGATASAWCEVEVRDGPTARFTIPSDPYLVGDEIPFSDASTSGAAPILSYEWDFDDGNSHSWGATGPPVPFGHAFTKAGPFSVTLTVDDGVFTDQYTLVVDPIMDEPQGIADVYLTGQEKPLAVPAPGLLGNDVHDLGWSLGVSGVQGPTEGTLDWSSDGSFTYTPPAGFSGVMSFTYDLTDGYTTVHDVPVEIDVRPFVGPTADFRFTVHGKQVVFDDHSLAGDHRIASWSWDFHDGAHGDVADPFHAYAEPGAHRATLRITDEAGLTDRLSKTFYIAAASLPPLEADQPPEAQAEVAGVLRPGNTVFLDGSGSGEGLHYSWSQVEGPRVALSGADTATPSFVVPEVGKDGAGFVFRLVVYDGRAFSDPAMLAFHVEHENRPPQVAVATPGTTVPAGAGVVLEATARDPDGDAMVLSWTQVSGPEVVLADDGTGKARFTAPVEEGTARFRFTADDGVAVGEGVAAVAFTGRGGPDAYFRAMSTPTGSVHFIDTTPGLSYTWDFGDRSAPAHVATPVHHYDENGTYLVTLVVTDDAGRHAKMQRLVDVQITQEQDDPDDMPDDHEDRTPAPRQEQEVATQAAMPTAGIVLLALAAVVVGGAGCFLLLRRR